MPAVTAALAERFRVEAHARTPVRVTALDTFDSRLATAGLTLQLRTSAGKDELVLGDDEQRAVRAGRRSPAAGD